jgi:phosphohistidine phosphatase
MKYLTLIRHAKSSWDDASLADHDRPLNERGLRNAPVMGKFIGKTYFGMNGAPALLPKPDRIVTSTAVRAKTTAEMMMHEMQLDHLVGDQRLYLAEPKTFLQIVRNFNDEWRHVMMFGHNPGISEFVDRMLKRGGIDEMPTCAVAILELPWDVWATVDWNEARLVGFITPKLLEKRFGESAESASSTPAKR